MSDSVRLGFWAVLQSKGFRAKVIKFPAVGVELELPKSISQVAPQGACLGVRTFSTAFDNVSKDRGDQLSVGGVLKVDLMVIPPFPVKRNSWVMRVVSA